MTPPLPPHIQAIKEQAKPGPWWVDDIGWPESKKIETNHWYGIYCEYGTGVVAKVEGYGQQAKATAELIARAPQMLAEIERLREALEWQPIETAPDVDDFEADLYIPGLGGRWTDCIWDTESKTWFNSAAQLTFGIDTSDLPTHWMPRPKPPIEALNPTGGVE
jgi:hypothetical protein